MAKYKNQHYVPWFYLKNFSFNEDKSLGYYSKKKDCFIPEVSSKNQCRKKYYYGEDAIIENTLSIIETDHSLLLSRILSEFRVPERNSKEHIDLLHLVSLLYLRNPDIINAKKVLIETIYGHSTDVIEVIHRSFLGFENVTNSISNLEYILLHNDSDIPFVTSDYPIIRFNQYMRSKNLDISDLGYSVKGIQILLPLSPKLCLLLFDDVYYDIVESSKKIYSIDSRNEIDSINALQLYNTGDKLYFNSEVTYEYIKTIKSRCQIASKASKVNNDKVFINGITDNIPLSNTEFVLQNNAYNYLSLELSFLRIKHIVK